MDSMVNKYTANKRLRSEDAYTPDGRPDMRPDYPSTVYSQILKKLFPDVPVVIGGIEASLRRLSHYDYWQDKVQKSILCDSGADLLIYGMGEKPLADLVKNMKSLLTTEEPVLKMTFNFIHTKNVWQIKRNRLVTSDISKKNPTNIRLHESHKQ